MTGKRISHVSEWSVEVFTLYETFGIMRDLQNHMRPSKLYETFKIICDLQNHMRPSESYETIKIP